MGIFKTRHTLPTILITISFGIMIWLIAEITGGGFFVGRTKIDWSKGSQFGDLVGGVLAFLSILFLYFTIRNQLFSFEKTQFENRFFQLLNFHRENVAKFSYKLPSSGSGEIVEGDKVLLHIFREVQQVNKDINDYFSRRGFPEIEHYIETKPITKAFYDRVRKERPNIPYKNLLILDIAYLIVFYGLSDESQNPLEIAINMRYSYQDFKPLIDDLKSKTAKWDKEERRDQIDSLIVKGYNYKFYGGHQVRLGHYFRHLYQLVHFVNKQEFLSFEEKYDYVKTLRAQLSTYEQGLLCYNSLSSLGYKWEYLADSPKQSWWGKNLLISNLRPSLNNELITKYNLVKNLPQGIINTFAVQMFYENVNFESFENAKSMRSKYIEKIYR